jgi:hypothetical protein
MRFAMLRSDCNHRSMPLNPLTPLSWKQLKPTITSKNEEEILFLFGSNPNISRVMKSRSMR